MEFFTWKNDYSINVKKVDTQHEKLVNILNELHQAMLSGKANDILEKILLELINYTVYHFNTEEEFMGKYNYTNKERHTVIHNQLKEKVGLYFNDFKNNKINKTELLFFLKEWLYKHILEEDHLLGKFLNEKGIF